MRLVNFFRIVLAAARVLLLIEFAKTTRSTGGFDCPVCKKKMENGLRLRFILHFALRRAAALRFLLLSLDTARAVAAGELLHLSDRHAALAEAPWPAVRHRVPGG